MCISVGAEKNEHAIVLARVCEIRWMKATKQCADAVYYS